ncbi:MAG: YmdB family metallophosphoesterase [Candidatus Magasanikbacteria bacterium]|nr:YmdB family metallophosphoesterase [Candidatus Magasanikbacteria bacterium]
MLKFLIFGDIVGKTGRKAVIKILPVLKRAFKPDLIIANAENLAHGTGVTPKTLAEMETAGISVFTGGDHIFAKPDAEKIFARKDCPLLRPANWPTTLGSGEKLLTVAKKRVLVINLVGRVFLGDKLAERGILLQNPFAAIEKIIRKYADEKPTAILVDFHTEATSEQVAMGYFLDGRASCLWGTHTHIPTADAQILKNGLGYITDVGMCGARNTVLGVDKNIVINRFVNDAKESFDWPEFNEATVNALYAEINPRTGRAVKIKLIQKQIQIA